MEWSKSQYTNMRYKMKIQIVWLFNISERIEIIEQL